MSNDTDVRILGLHGKGASGPIMRAQTTLLTRAAGIEEAVTYVSGPLACQPYHSLERFFPPTKYTYHAWYHSASPATLRQTHAHVRSLLLQARRSKDSDSDSLADPPHNELEHDPVAQPVFPGQTHFLRAPPLYDSQHSLSMTNLAQQSEDESSTPGWTTGSSNSGSTTGYATPHSGPPAARPITTNKNSSNTNLSLKIPKRVMFTMEDLFSPVHRRVPATPITAARTASQLRPALAAAPSCSSSMQEGSSGAGELEAMSSEYDGIICFSQGCAVTAGYLLEQAAAHSLGCAGSGAPIPKFVIFICGSRPFPAREGWTKGSTHTDLPLYLPGKLINIPTLHLVGRLDPAQTEGYRLASLCNPNTRNVIKFDGGHAPPRKRTDLDRIVPAIKALLHRARAETA